MPDVKSEELKKTSGVPAPERPTGKPSSFNKLAELNRQEMESSQAPENEESAEEVELVDVETDGSDDQRQEPSEVDYAAELDRLRKERDNLREGIKNEKAKNKRRSERDEPEEESFDDEDSSSPQDTSSMEDRIVERVSRLAYEQQQQFEANKEREHIDTTLRQLSESEGEMDLIKYHYDNSIKHSGYSKQSINNDLQTAKLLANRSRLMDENEELRLALQSKATLNDKPQFGGAKTFQPSSNSKVKVTKTEKKLLERYGALDRFKDQAKK